MSAALECLIRYLPDGKKQFAFLAREGGGLCVIRRVSEEYFIYPWGAEKTDPQRISLEQIGSSLDLMTEEEARD